MEHRWSERRTIIGEVVIECPKHGSVRGRITNLSAGGMFVETEAELPFSITLVVGFRLRSERRSDSYRVRAAVVHRSRAGVGLMFDDREIDVLQGLRVMLIENDAMTSELQADLAA